MIYTLLKTIKYVKLIFQTKKSHEFQNNIVLTLTIPIAQSPSTDKKEECSLQKDKILEMEVVREQGLEVISIDFRKYYCPLINPIIKEEKIFPIYHLLFRLITSVNFQENWRQSVPAVRYS